ncbi:cytochrome P450 [Trametes polyzona]|nr:cytochrome P450 [Trametes polyzona]
MLTDILKSHTTPENGYTPIPSPPGVPGLGNIGAIDKDLPIKSLHELALKYGEIYQLNVGASRFLPSDQISYDECAADLRGTLGAGATMVVINSRALLNEVSDDKKFYKKIAANSMQLRNAAGDGLFTARAPEEQNWGIAHRILMPIFTAGSVCTIADDMLDIVSQLVLKWERFGAEAVIDAAEDCSKVTLDTICLAAMGFRLNSFYREDPHPLGVTMADFLLESTKRGATPPAVQALLVAENAKYEEDMKKMFAMAQEMIEHRRANPTDKQDVLNVMMHGRDTETGLSLPDKTVQYNILTFLIAGHETTSGMLTFAIYYLLKNPETLRKLREEIDTKIGGRPFTTADLNTLPYLIAVMRETLRLDPTAPARTVAPFEDTALLGKYFVAKDTSITVNTYDCQRDKTVWGEDAEEFRPERMLDGKFEALPPNAWQAFGHGMRACIGGAFAWQEGQIALVTILQHFDLVMNDPSYELQMKQTLSIKPKDFFIRAIPRKDSPHLFVPKSINTAVKA